ncbi:MAG TPA: hypothetical protein VLX32_04810 [Candidatus Acidoferrum sp.]|nr:hypothetical protein [Candidatus Acidoferrum sp.]
MKLSNAAKGLLFGASLLLAGSVFAGQKTNLEVYDNLKVNGTSIPAGKYQVEWDGSGPDVKLNIRQDGSTVATLPAHITQLKNAYPTTGYSTRKESDGTLSLTSVFVGGKKYVLEIGEEVVASPATSAKPEGNN